MEYILKEELFVKRFNINNRSCELNLYIKYSIDHTKSYVDLHTGDGLEWDYYANHHYEDNIFFIYPSKGMIDIEDDQYQFIIME